MNRTLISKYPPSLVFLFLVICIMVSFCSCSRNKKYTGWAVTGGGKENLRYSSLKQIDTGNVSKLEIAWIYHSENNDSTNFGVMECNPIIIDSTLYGVSPKLKLFAINAATGKEKWQFDPADSLSNKTWHRKSVNMNRGLPIGLVVAINVSFIQLGLLYLK